MRFTPEQRRLARDMKDRAEQVRKEEKANRIRRQKEWQEASLIRKEFGFGSW